MGSWCHLFASRGFSTSHRICASYDHTYYLLWNENMEDRVKARFEMILQPREAWGVIPLYKIT